jgi:hypothetical protein
MEKTEFWLTVCRLAGAYNEQGLTTDERIAELTVLFRALPPIVQGQVLRSTMQLAMNLPDLYAAIAAAANALERGKSSYFDAG